jgi:hypothetical protein
VPAVIEATDSSFNHYWSELFANDPLQSAIYSPHTRACLGNTPPDLGFVNRSFVIVYQNQPVFACSLTMHIDDGGKKRLGYFGFEASTHINRQSMESSSNNFQPEAVFLLQRHINALIEEIKPDSLDYLDPVSCGLMSPVTQVLLEKGAQPILQTAKIINLSHSFSTLHRNLQKSMRAMIHWGRRNLGIRLVSSENFDTDAATALHQIYNAAIASGQEPCSSQSTYETLIRQDKAFLVEGRRGNVPVSAALFLYADCTCHFILGSALSQTTVRPLLHALIWEAVQHSKRIGCMQFEMGRLGKSEPEDSARAKLLNGFGADSQTRLKLRLVSQ